METILLITVIGILCIVCFFIGAKIGQKTVKGEDIKVPKITINPKKIYEQHLEKQEIEKEQSKLETIMKNIERYDGTDFGQEDVPE